MSGRLTILLVEDEVINAMLLRMQLEAAGYSVRNSVVSGEDAISAAQEFPYDVIIMDIRLAGEMDGVEAAMRIREDHEAAFIFVTGYDDPRTRDRASSLGPLAYLNKPIIFSELARQLDRLND